VIIHFKRTKILIPKAGHFLTHLKYYNLQCVFAPKIAYIWQNSFKSTKTIILQFLKFYGLP